MAYKLVRDKDNLTKISPKIKWITFDKETNKFEDSFDTIKEDRALIMSPFNESFNWMTTTVTEILEEKNGYIKFRTENSVYELFEIEDEIEEEVIMGECEECGMEDGNHKMDCSKGRIELFTSE